MGPAAEVGLEILAPPMSGVRLMSTMAPRLDPGVKAVLLLGWGFQPDRKAVAGGDGEVGVAIGERCDNFLSTTKIFRHSPFPAPPTHRSP